MNKWTQRFLDLAHLVSTWSKDPSTKVGAVIVDPNNRVVSLGFNGFPKGVQDMDIPRERKLMRTIHAEENALLFAQRDLSDCSIYVTHHPCSNCAAKIIQAGIRRVSISREMGDRWAHESAEAKLMFSESGVVLDLVTDKNAEVVISYLTNVADMRVNGLQTYP